MTKKILTLALCIGVSLMGVAQIPNFYSGPGGPGYHNIYCCGNTVTKFCNPYPPFLATSPSFHYQWQWLDTLTGVWHDHIDSVAPLYATGSRTSMIKVHDLGYIMNNGLPFGPCGTSPYMGTHFDRCRVTVDGYPNDTVTPAPVGSLGTLGLVATVRPVADTTELEWQVFHACAGDTVVLLGKVFPQDPTYPNLDNVLDPMRVMWRIDGDTTRVFIGPLNKWFRDTVMITGQQGDTVTVQMELMQGSAVRQIESICYGPAWTYAKKIVFDSCAPPPVYCDTLHDTTYVTVPPVRDTVYLTPPPIHDTVYLVQPPVHDTTYVIVPPVHDTTYVTVPPVRDTVYLTSPPVHDTVHVLQPPVHDTTYVIVPPVLDTIYVPVRYDSISIIVRRDTTFQNRDVYIIERCDGARDTIFNCSLSIYPNPTEELAYVYFPERTTEPYSIDLYDMLGHLVFHKDSVPWSLTPWTADLNQYAAGEYIIMLRTGPKKRWVCRIMKIE